MKQEGAKSEVIKDMEANEKIISGELTRKREKLLKQYKKLKYKTVKEKGSSSLDKSKITKSSSASDAVSFDEVYSLSSFIF